MRNINLAIKRIIDIVGSGVGLIIFLPIFLVNVVLLEVFLPGPIFFKQQRVGKDGRLFSILKFRSMKVDRKAEVLHDFSNDVVRLTNYGKLIRRLKIDELPQLLNVFRGDMSLVGPRPTVKEQVDMYTERQYIRLKMKPGMTGLAQVNGNIFLSWDDRIEYDLKYIEKFSVILDLRILIKTVLVVFFGEEKFRKLKSL